MSRLGLCGDTAVSEESSSGDDADAAGEVFGAECAVQRHGQRRLIAAEETRSRPGRQNAQVPAGSNCTRESLTPAPWPESGANNGNVPVGAHIVPV